MTIDDVPLTANQRFQALSSLGSLNTTSHYSFQAVWATHQNVSEQAAYEVIRKVEERHPLLKTRLTNSDSRLFLSLASDAPEQERRVLSRVEALSLGEASVIVETLLKHRLDLQGGEVWRMAVVATPRDETIVAVQVSHVIADRDGFGNLCRSVQSAVIGDIPGSPSVDLRDFAAFAHSLAEREKSQSSRLLERCQDLLAADWPVKSAMEMREPDIPAIASGRLSVRFDEIDSSARRKSATSMALCLSALKRAWEEEVGGGSLLVALPISLRPTRQFGTALGDFTNMILLRLYDPDVSEAMRALTLAMIWRHTHITAISAQMGVPDAAQIRVDIDRAGSQTSPYPDSFRPVHSRKTITTRRGMSIQLRELERSIEVTVALHRGFESPAPDRLLKSFKDSFEEAVK